MADDTKDDSDFEKIANADDKLKYWNAALETKTVLVTQLSNGETVLLTPVEMKSNHLFVTSSPNSLPNNDSNILVSFNALKDRLFIRSQLTKTADGKHFIDTISELFRLQRRENFRIVIPETSPLPVFVNQLCEKNVKIKAQVVDISLGGALIEIPDPEMNFVILNGDWIAGIISPEKETGIQFKGYVKHVRDLEKLRKRRVGVFFDKLVGNGLNELNKLVMKYYHKMFSKFSNF